MNAMTIHTVKYQKKHTVVLCLAVMASAWAVLSYPIAAANGVRHGLSVCGGTLIPSLFPFLVLGGFLVRSGLGDRIGRRCQRLTSFLFRLPGCCAPAIVIGLIGGYPAGAAATAELIRSRRISADEGRRLLWFCVNGGPAFLVSAVGVGLLGSRAHGWLLLGVHWFTALAIGVLSRFKATPSLNTAVSATEPPSLATALAESVQAACRSLFGMCGFVLAASSLLFLGDAIGLPVALSLPLSCLLEVSCGCLAAASAGAAAPFFLGFALGFGGLSVHGQVAVCTPSLVDRRFVAVRVLHGVSSGILTWWLWRYIPVTISAFAVGHTSVLPSSASWTGAVSLMALGCVYLLSLCRREKAPK